eukprot:GHVH01012965.1.p1 GENE.GHVH01012965.1~~GHVH01012965.1.p1  ORF type:complete len:170 (+),score=10.29 GHVH01012965.1:336-845(+)
MASFLTVEPFSFAIHTSPYYPQGNAINEASHQAISRTLRSRLQASSSSSLTFAAVLADTILSHNASHQSAIGDSPFFRLFGKDPCLPGLQEYMKATVEPERLSTLQTRLLDQLSLEDTPLPSTADAPTPVVTFQVGDIVLFPRTPFERSRDSPPAGLCLHVLFASARPP